REGRRERREQRGGVGGDGDRTGARGGRVVVGDSAAAARGEHHRHEGERGAARDAAPCAGGSADHGLSLFTFFSRATSRSARHAAILLKATLQAPCCRTRFFVAFILQCSEGCATMLRFRPISERFLFWKPRTAPSRKPPQPRAAPEFRPNPGRCQEPEIRPIVSPVRAETCLPLW